MGAKLDLQYLARAYFYVDKPVDYQLNKDTNIQIFPISVMDSEIFLHSVDILTIDKNATPNADIIRMSYLEFIIRVLLPGSQAYIDKFVNILRMCLHLDNVNIYVDEFGSYFLQTLDGKCKITSKRFDEIRRIILYQNLIDYDDDYINPELKAAMRRTDELKSRDLADITIERKMAIITAHTGILKRDQLDMTYRSHSLLFREVCGEVDYLPTWPIALYAGQTDKIDHWIHKKAKNKFDGYIVGQGEISSKFGARAEAAQSSSSDYDEMYENFNK